MKNIKLYDLGKYKFIIEIFALLFIIGGPIQEIGILSSKYVYLLGTMYN